MTTQNEALRMALEAMESTAFDEKWYAAKEAIREALAAPQGEPRPPHECKTEAEKVAYAAGWWKALEVNHPAPAPLSMNVQAMVNRFLGWKLPKDFYPDCGISFDGRKDDEWNKNKTWPTGTNLLTADQAKAMFEYCLGWSGRL